MKSGKYDTSLERSLRAREAQIQRELAQQRAKEISATETQVLDSSAVVHDDKEVIDPSLLETPDNNEVYTFEDPVSAMGNVMSDEELDALLDDEDSGEFDLTSEASSAAQTRDASSVQLAVQSYQKQIRPANMGSTQVIDPTELEGQSIGEYGSSDESNFDSQFQAELQDFVKEQNAKNDDGVKTFAPFDTFDGGDNDNFQTAGSPYDSRFDPESEGYMPELAQHGDFEAALNKIGEPSGIVEKIEDTPNGPKKVINLVRFQGMLYRGESFEGFKLEGTLDNMNLRQMFGSGASLAGLDLSGVTARKTNFDGIDMRGVILDNAGLEGSSFMGTKLQGASLVNAKLKGADMTSAKLSNANLEDADLREATLIYAQLDGADLTFAQLDKAELARANLANAVLENASLFQARLENTMLIGADLTDASLEEAVLQATNLRKAIFKRTDLSGMEIHSNVIFGGTKFDKELICNKPIVIVESEATDFDFETLTRGTRTGTIKSISEIADIFATTLALKVILKRYREKKIK